MTGSSSLTRAKSESQISNGQPPARTEVNSWKTEPETTVTPAQPTGQQSATAGTAIPAQSTQQSAETAPSAGQSQQPDTTKQNLDPNAKDTANPIDKTDEKDSAKDPEKADPDAKDSEAEKTDESQPSMLTKAGNWVAENALTGAGTALASGVAGYASHHMLGSSYPQSTQESTSSHQDNKKSQSEAEQAPQQMPQQGTHQGSQFLSQQNPYVSNNSSLLQNIPMSSSVASLPTPTADSFGVGFNNGQQGSLVGGVPSGLQQGSLLGGVPSGLQQGSLVGGVPSGLQQGSLLGGVPSGFINNIGLTGGGIGGGGILSPMGISPFNGTPLL